MLYRTQISNGRPVSRREVNWARRQLKRHIRRFRPAGSTELIQNRAGFRYLAARGAKGCTMSQELIMLGAHPSRSVLYEELLHAMQCEMGLREVAADLNGMATVTILMEVLAARILVTRERRWNIPIRERIENRRRLRGFSCKLRKEPGGVRGLCL